MDSKKEIALCTFLILLFILIASYEIKYPGLYYDEALFVNAATGGSYSNLFISERFFGIPWKLMPYIGALKAWIFFPIFKFFDISFFTIRFPSICIVAFSLFLNYRSIRNLFGVSSAVIFLFLSSVEPLTIFSCRLDWGPTSLMMFFKALIIFYFSSWYKDRFIQKKYFLLIILFSFLGLFDKLNFSWFIISFFLMAYTCFFKTLNKNFFLNLNKYLVLTFLLIFVLMFFGISNNVDIKSYLFGFNFIDRLLQLQNLVMSSISGVSIFKFVTGKDLPAGILQNFLILFLFLISFSFFLANIFYNFIDKRLTLLFNGVIFFLLINMFVTKVATGPHHVSILAPLWLIPIASSFGFFFDFLIKNKRYFLLFFTSIPIFILFFSSIYIDTLYLYEFKRNFTPRWDIASTKLVKSLEINNYKSVSCVDWGECTIIQALSNNTIKVFDYSSWFTSDIDDYLNKILSEKTIFIVPSINKESFVGNRKFFFKWLDKYQHKYLFLYTIYDSYNKPIYEIYSVN